MKNKTCKHKNAYPFHENAPWYCPDCDNYIKEEEIFKINYPHKCGIMKSRDNNYSGLIDYNKWKANVRKIILLEHKCLRTLNADVDLFGELLDFESIEKIINSDGSEEYEVSIFFGDILHNYILNKNDFCLIKPMENCSVAVLKDFYVDGDNKRSGKAFNCDIQDKLIYANDNLISIEISDIYRLHRGYYIDSYQGDEINMNKGAEKLLNKLINRVDKLEEQTNNALKNIKKDLDTYKDIEEKEKLKEKELPWWCVKGMCLKNKKDPTKIIYTTGINLDIQRVYHKSGFCSFDCIKEDYNPIGGVFDFIDINDVLVEFYDTGSCKLYDFYGESFSLPIWFDCPKEFKGNKYDLKDFLK